MKGYGSYRFQDSVERKPGVLLLYRGDRGIVRFHDGLTQALPAKPLRDVGVEPDGRFVLVVVRRGPDLQEVRVEPIAAARPRVTPRAPAKVVVRQGRKLVTRR